MVVAEDSTSYAEGYRRGLLAVGWDGLKNYDNLILCNSSLIGPFFPTSTMYEAMDNVKCDYWGIVKHYECKSGPYPHNKYGGIPEHLQSSFLVFKKIILENGSLFQFFKSMPLLKKEEESLGGFSIRIHHFLETGGYKHSTYIDDIAFKAVTDDPYLFKSYELLRDYNSPFIEKLPFYVDISRKIKKTSNVNATRLLKYIESEQLYPVEDIWGNLLRNHNIYDLKNNLNLNYIISDYQQNEITEANQKVALLLHIYYMDLLPVCFSYIKHLPEYADVYITTNSEEKKQEILKSAKEKGIRISSIMVVKNRGRDVSALLVDGKNLFKGYDLVCFIHDKKSSHQDFGIVGESFFLKCMDNLLNSSNHINEIINIFTRNKRLGVLMPPLPGFAYFKLYGKGWDRNYIHVEFLVDLLNLDISISEDISPLGPFGSMFWFRPDAIQQILNHNWKYEDFPEEPLGIDGTISHAIERIYPYIAQQNGYYSAYVMSEEYAAADLTNSHFVINSFNKVLFDKFCIFDFNLLYKTLKSMKNKRLYSYVLFRDQQVEVKKKLKNILPYSMFLNVIKLKRLIFGPRNLQGYFDDSSQINKLL